MSSTKQELKAYLKVRKATIQGKDSKGVSMDVKEQNVRLEELNNVAAKFGISLKD